MLAVGHRWATNRAREARRREMGDESQCAIVCPRSAPDIARRFAEFERTAEACGVWRLCRHHGLGGRWRFVAIGGAIWQVGEVRNTQREATAYQAFDSYLRLAIDHPDLVCVPTQQDMEAIVANERDNKRYSVFLGIMLSASETNSRRPPQRRALARRDPRQSELPCARSLGACKSGGRAMMRFRANCGPRSLASIWA